MAWGVTKCSREGRWGRERDLSLGLRTVASTCRAAALEALRVGTGGRGQVSQKAREGNVTRQKAQLATSKTPKGCEQTRPRMPAGFTQRSQFGWTVLAS